MASDKMPTWIAKVAATDDAPVTVTVAEALAAEGEMMARQTTPGWQRDRTLLRLLAAAAREMMDALSDRDKAVARLNLAAILGPAPGDGDGG